VIGVHTPEFTFAQYESNVERASRVWNYLPGGRGQQSRNSGKPSPTVLPTKYLLDKDGYLRYGHFWQGGYGECEQVIQELIHEVRSLHRSS